MTSDRENPGRGPAAAQAITAAGVASATAGLLLATLCCWAPALIVALGIGSLYALLYGYRYVFGAVGAALVIVGLLYARKQRGFGVCGCESPLDAPEGDENV